MRLHRNLPSACLTALLLASSLGAQSGIRASVQRVSVISQNPLELQIQTTRPVTSESQIVSSPERLVIDIPNASPGANLRALKVSHGEMLGVRVGLFSTNPPVTRIVLDLKEPQWYRVTPNASGLLVSLGSDAENPVDQQSTIGWVSTQSAQPVTAKAVAVQAKKVSPKRTWPRQKGVSVAFENGLMSIHSGGATLSEILYQIQKTTGAEIAIPAGTEQEKVAADFGPGTPSEVLGQLLNGTGLNFVVVGSEADPNALRSVILSAKDSGVQSPGYAPAYTPPVAENVEPPNPDGQFVPPQPDAANQQPQPEEPDVQRQPNENAPQPNENGAQPGQPAAGPPPDPPPTN